MLPSYESPALCHTKLPNRGLVRQLFLTHTERGVHQIKHTHTHSNNSSFSNHCQVFVLLQTNSTQALKQILLGDIHENGQRGVMAVKQGTHCLFLSHSSSVAQSSGVRLQVLTGPFLNKHQIGFVKHRVTHWLSTRHAAHWPDAVPLSPTRTWKR